MYVKGIIDVCLEVNVNSHVNGYTSDHNTYTFLNKFDYNFEFISTL